MYKYVITCFPQPNTDVGLLYSPMRTWPKRKTQPLSLPVNIWLKFTHSGIN